MKLIHISDIHLNPAKILGDNPIEQFKKVIANVETHHMDADKIVITGDLTHVGMIESYEALRDILAASKLKDHLDPVLMVGNHDTRENFYSIFPDKPKDENGFCQYYEETKAGLFVYLDTKLEDSHSGEYCTARRAWLRSVLETAKAKQQAVWLFMHHNPVSVRVANADIINLIDEADFHVILKEYRDIIRHIFFGHCHYSLSGSVCGIPFSAPRSTSHPNWPEFSGDPKLMGYGPIEKNFNICFLSERDTIVHTIDYEREADIKWLTLA